MSYVRGEFASGRTVTFELRVSNTGDRLAEALKIRIRRLNLSQFDGFNVTANPPGSTAGTDRLGYRFSTTGSAANPDGLAILTGQLDPGKYATLEVKLQVASTYVPGSVLEIGASAAGGGCR